MERIRGALIKKLLAAVVMVALLGSLFFWYQAVYQEQEIDRMSLSCTVVEASKIYKSLNPNGFETEYFMFRALRKTGEITSVYMPRDTYQNVRLETSYRDLLKSYELAFSQGAFYVFKPMREVGDMLAIDRRSLVMEQYDYKGNERLVMLKYECKEIAIDEFYTAAKIVVGKVRSNIQI